VIQPPSITPALNPWPVVGIVGGIGSGKSLVAQMFADLGCRVVSSDEAAHAALRDAKVKSQVIALFGPAIVDDRHEIDRRRLGVLVFSDKQRLEKLNAVVHPYVAEYRRRCMKEYQLDRNIKAVIMDSPLLVESGLHHQCDSVVYVLCGNEGRFSRVQKTRGWSVEEWKKRELAQCPLDKKLEISDYVVSNEGDMPHAAEQVNWVLTCITRDFQRSHGLRGMVN